VGGREGGREGKTGSEDKMCVTVLHATPDVNGYKFHHARGTLSGVLDIY
jgi:hypothetical protein